jgi:hypothetical protein
VKYPLPSLTRATISLLIAANVVCSLTGCVLVPFVQAFKESGLTEGDRMNLLPPQIKRFNDAQIFGNKTAALALIASEAQAEISKQLQARQEGERLVRSEVEEIEWIDSARKARVVLKVESFKVSHLIVGAKREEQRWEFTAGSGWLMTSRQELS